MTKKYVGQVSPNGKRTGKGISYGDDTLVSYNGEWQNDLYHGQGTLYNARLPGSYLEKSDEAIQNLNSVGEHWVKYEGRFSNGKYDGPGVLILSNADKATGGWKMGQLTGAGAYL